MLERHLRTRFGGLYVLDGMLPALPLALIVLPALPAILLPRHPATGALQ
jgi:hypothetical protein